ncbi:MAG: hypothetical protein IJ083_06270 [Clostridia bacterium]|nr:hypothetical protein [Clostridia bacterium]
MSITKSYNRKTDTYYVYETTYVWDEEKQKKVQKRRCIGKLDEKTNTIMPTGQRGQPREKAIKPAEEAPLESRALHPLDQEAFVQYLKTTEASIMALQAAILEMRQNMEKLSKAFEIQSPSGDEAHQE